MFYGEYRHALDKKGRVTIPVKFREILNSFNKNSFIITRGFERSLFIFSTEEWKNQEEKFKSLLASQGEQMEMNRIFFSGIYHCSLDKQGRINLPQSLIQYAEIKKEVVIVGVFKRIEIWDSSKWQNYLNKSEKFLSQITKGLITGVDGGKIETL